MKKKKQKSNKKKKVIIIVILLIILSVCGYFVYSKYFKKTEQKKVEVKVIKEISKYGYSLNENHTKVYKKYFAELEDVLNKDEIDYDKYAELCAKLFIIDFYTLDTKLSKNDIGGLQFIKLDMKDNFIDQARGTFYRYVEVKTDDRDQKLPEVSDILSATVEKASFTYTDGTVDNDAYKVTISWDYKEDLGYEKEAKMILVKSEEKLYIVEMN